MSNLWVVLTFLCWTNTGTAPAAGEWFNLIQDVGPVEIRNWSAPMAQPQRAEIEAAAPAALAWWRRREENQAAPDTGFANLDRKDRALLRVLFKVARLSTPQLESQTFLKQVRAEWDAEKPDGEGGP